MINIKEVKEFFVRLNAVTTGKLRDRETTFKKQYPSTAGDLAGLYKMFLKEHIPSEEVFKKLFSSITFALNYDDTAFEKQQGLVMKATDANAILRSSLDNIGLDGLGGGGLSQDTENTASNGYKYLVTNNYTTCVLPHQLPNIFPDRLDETGGTVTSSVIYKSDGIQVEHNNIALTGLHSGRTRRNFTIKAYVDEQSITIENDKIEAKGLTDTVTIVESVVVDGEGAVTNIVYKNLHFTKGVLTSIS